MTITCERILKRATRTFSVFDIIEDNSHFCRVEDSSPDILSVGDLVEVTFSVVAFSRRDNSVFMQCMLRAVAHISSELRHVRDTFCIIIIPILNIV